MDSQEKIRAAYNICLFERFEALVLMLQHNEGSASSDVFVLEDTQYFAAFRVLGGKCGIYPSGRERNELFVNHLQSVVNEFRPETRWTIIADPDRHIIAGAIRHEAEVRDIVAVFDRDTRLFNRHIEYLNEGKFAFVYAALTRTQFGAPIAEGKA